MLDETPTKRGAAILFCTEFVRSNFVQHSPHIHPTFIPFRPTFVQHSPQLVCTASKLYRVWDAGFTFASETAEKRRHSLPESGCGQMLPLGMETEVALPYLFRFAAFFNDPAASYLGHRNFSFFDGIAGSKNKSFLLILTIATNLTFGLLLARPAVREGESDGASLVALDP